MGDSAAFSVFAPAKINLSLHVIARRADGYHMLDSLVAFAGIGDRVGVQRADDFALTITGPFADTLGSQGGANLVLRAARYLAAVSGRKEGAHFTLEKNLPVAAGLGGGSSDAAAALSALAQLWKFDAASLSDSDLAAKLGADVPVCLRRAPTFMRGIGDELAPAPKLPPAWLVLVNPRRPLATKAVFAALGGRFSKPVAAEQFAGLQSAGELARALAAAGNDLAAPASALMPEIAEMLGLIESTQDCLLARMSGSGPTCFGLYGAFAAAEAAAKALQGARPGWWVTFAPLL